MLKFNLNWCEDTGFSVHSRFLVSKRTLFRPGRLIRILHMTGKQRKITVNKKCKMLNLSKKIATFILKFMQSTNLSELGRVGVPLYCSAVAKAIFQIVSRWLWQS